MSTSTASLPQTISLDPPESDSSSTESIRSGQCLRRSQSWPPALIYYGSDLAEEVLAETKEADDDFAIIDDEQRLKKLSEPDNASFISSYTADFNSESERSSLAEKKEGFRKTVNKRWDHFLHKMSDNARRSRWERHKEPTDEGWPDKDKHSAADKAPTSHRGLLRRRGSSLGSAPRSPEIRPATQTIVPGESLKAKHLRSPDRKQAAVAAKAGAKKKLRNPPHELSVSRTDIGSHPVAFGYHPGLRPEFTASGNLHFMKAPKQRSRSATRRRTRPLWQAPKQNVFVVREEKSSHERLNLPQETVLDGRSKKSGISSKLRP